MRGAVGISHSQVSVQGKLELPSGQEFSSWALPALFQVQGGMRSSRGVPKPSGVGRTTSPPGAPLHPGSPDTFPKEMQGMWDVSFKAGRESQYLGEAGEERWREQKSETLMLARDERDKDICLEQSQSPTGEKNGYLPALAPSRKGNRPVSKGKRQVRKELPLCGNWAEQRRHHSRAV